MAGLLKPNKRQWQETNMEFFGSDTEREVSLECSMRCKVLREGHQLEINLSWKYDLMARFLSLRFPRISSLGIVFLHDSRVYAEKYLCIGLHSMTLSKLLDVAKNTVK